MHRIIRNEQDYYNALDIDTITATAQELALTTVYPVGSYYETSNADFNPATAWGGSWVLENSGMAHISGASSGTYQVNGASGDGGKGTKDIGNNTISYTPKADVGVTIAQHTLTSTEIPLVSGSVSVRGYQTSSGTNGANLVSASGVFSRLSTSSTSVIKSPVESGGRTSVINLSFGGGAAHGHSGSTGSFTGNAAYIDVRQPSIYVYRWHRVA